MKNIERLENRLAHLITTNSEEPFNKIWVQHFADFENGILNYMTVEEMIIWFNKEEEEEQEE